MELHWYGTNASKYLSVLCQLPPLITINYCCSYATKQIIFCVWGCKLAPRTLSHHVCIGLFQLAVASYFSVFHISHTQVLHRPVQEIYMYLYLCGGCLHLFTTFMAISLIRSQLYLIDLIFLSFSPFYSTGLSDQTIAFFQCFLSRCTYVCV